MSTSEALAVVSISGEGFPTRAHHNRPASFVKHNVNHRSLTTGLSLDLVTVPRSHTQSSANHATRPESEASARLFATQALRERPRSFNP